MSSRLKGGVKKSNKAQVRETEARSAAIEKQFLPSTHLNPAEANTELGNARGDAEHSDTRIARDRNHFPIHATLKGHWTQPSSKDTDKAIKMQLVKKAEKGVNGPFGQIMQSEDDISWMKEKKLQDENWAQTRLLGYLIDPLQPESQDIAYAIAPELKSYPEQVHLENLALQEALRVLLRDGKLGGKEDNALIYHILRPDFKLPLNPVWDPDGLIIKAAAGNYGIKTIDQQLAAARGLFSPRNWAGIPKRASDQYDDLHTDIKVMILKRLYPGLRYKKADWIKQFVIPQLSPSDIATAGSVQGSEKDSNLLWPLGGFDNNSKLRPFNAQAQYVDYF
jgi:hypothetical protein